MPSTHYAWNGGRNLWHWRGRHSEILGGSLASFSPIRDPALKTNSTCSQFQSALYLPSPDHSSGLRAWPDHVPQHWLLCWRLSLNPSAIPLPSCSLTVGVSSGMTSTTSRMTSRFGGWYAEEYASIYILCSSFLIYNFRIFERRHGSRKFASFCLGSWFLSVLFAFILVEAMYYSFGVIVVNILPFGFLALVLAVCTLLLLHPMSSKWHKLWASCQ